MTDPVLTLNDSKGTVLVTDDNFEDDPSMAAQLAANGLARHDPRESGIFTTLPAGQITVILSGKSGSVGVGLIEIYSLR